MPGKKKTQLAKEKKHIQEHRRITLCESHLERFLAGVHALVRLQMMFLLKPFVAVVAFESFVAIVNVGMSRQIAFSRERLILFVLTTRDVTVKQLSLQIFT